MKDLDKTVITRSQQKDTRILEYDIIRVVACMMVIIIHAPMPSENANGYLLAAISYLNAPCIGLFFIVSGALLLPIKDWQSFLEKRLSKVVFPTFFWSIFYISLNTFKTDFDVCAFLKQVLSIPFSPQGNGIMWFMYTIIGLYLMTPIVSKWLEYSSKKEVEYYLIFWMVSLCYPILEIFLNISFSNTSTFFYFSGFLGYYILGYYMRAYPYCCRRKYLFIAVVVSLVVPVMCKLLHWDIDFYSLFWFLSFFVVIGCIFWYQFIFKIAKHIPINKFKKHLISLSNLSFGIYFIHIFIMRTILWNCEWIQNISSYVFQTCIVTVLTALISYMVCLVLSYLPKSDYIIGYHKK